jgi:hypothetical protein
MIEAFEGAWGAADLPPHPSNPSSPQIKPMLRRPKCQRRRSGLVMAVLVVFTCVRPWSYGYEWILTVAIPCHAPLK